MATQKKNLSSPLSWIRRIRNKLTSRMACFVWGALFGNAILSQPINPLNLLLQPPEYMLSASSRAWLQLLRERIRELTGGLQGTVLDTVRDSLPALQPSLPTPASLQPASPPHSQHSPTGEDFSDCTAQFPAQRPLQVAAISTQWAPLALCSEGFAVLYSGLTRTPLVVVERLDRVRLQQAAGLQRTDQFYADNRVPATQRAQLSDYQGSGYDRGHLAAAANQASPKAMAESFALSNMVPQDPTHNRKVWSKLESDIRKYVQRAAGNVFVFTGSLHEGPPRAIGRSGIWVPSHLFKLVYDEKGQRAWAYVLPNKDDAQITRPMDYESFVQRTQWRLLAGLPIQGSIRE